MFRTIVLHSVIVFYSSTYYCNCSAAYQICFKAVLASIDMIFFLNFSGVIENERRKKQKNVKHASDWSETRKSIEWNTWELVWGYFPNILFRCQSNHRTTMKMSHDLRTNCLEERGNDGIQSSKQIWMIWRSHQGFKTLFKFKITDIEGYLA